MANQGKVPDTITKENDEATAAEIMLPDGIRNHYGSPNDDYVKEWISKIEERSSETDSVYSTSATESDISESYSNLNLNDNSITSTRNLSYVQNIYHQTKTEPSIDNVVIKNSKNIHVGNITVVRGPVYYKEIIYENTGTDGSETRNHQSTSQNGQKTEERNSDDIFIGQIKRYPATVLTIVDRRAWSARKPLLPYDYINKPVSNVIIYHTASASGETQAENTYMVKIIQDFHIDSRGWNDVGYNFLIGNDGLIYEGRGWNVVGAHATGYNKTSVGISFIGCFMKELPPKHSLESCKKLIEKGVSLGHIADNYKIIGHCQVTPTQSPGKRLFEEIKTWPHFSELE